jgi:hypothetical protein
MFSYIVCATFTTPSVADEWIAWLRDEHLADVCAAGALDAELIRFDSSEDGCRCEVRYHFASRQAFAAYEKNHAPRLRAEGLKRFPAGRGVTYERRAGESLVQVVKGE